MGVMFPPAHPGGFWGEQCSTEVSGELWAWVWMGGGGRGEAVQPLDVQASCARMRERGKNPAEGQRWVAKGPAMQGGQQG